MRPWDHQLSPHQPHQPHQPSSLRRRCRRWRCQPPHQPSPSSCLNRLIIRSPLRLQASWHVQWSQRTPGCPVAGSTSSRAGGARSCYVEPVLPGGSAIGCRCGACLPGRRCRRSGVRMDEIDDPPFHWCMAPRRRGGSGGRERFAVTAKSSGRAHERTVRRACPRARAVPTPLLSAAAGAASGRHRRAVHRYGLPPSHRVRSSRPGRSTNRDPLLIRRRCEP